MKSAWTCLLAGVLLGTGCLSLPKADEMKKEEPVPPPTVVKPPHPVGKLTPEMVNEANAAEIARRLQQELEREEAGAAAPVP